MRDYGDKVSPMMDDPSGREVGEDLLQPGQLRRDPRQRQRVGRGQGGLLLLVAVAVEQPGGQPQPQGSRALTERAARQGPGAVPVKQQLGQARAGPDAVAPGQVPAPRLEARPPPERRLPGPNTTPPPPPPPRPPPAAP